MENRNLISPTVIRETPVGGSASDITCKKCPSACCRKEMIVPLTKQEAKSLESAGTSLSITPKNTWGNNRPGHGRSFYTFESNCGNLAIDDNGATSCKIWESDKYPRACQEFTMGSFACVFVQLSRVDRGEDIFKK